MAFKQGDGGFNPPKTVIQDGPLILATDLTDSDGGVFNYREGNLNLDLSTGNIFTIPNPGTNKARLKEKLTMTNFPSGGEIKKISVVMRGRGSVKTSPSTSSFGTPSTKLGNYHANPNFTFGDNGNYFFWTDGDSGYMYCRRYSCPTPYDISGFSNNSYDQNVRFDTSFISISRYTYPSNSGMFIFNDDGTKIYFSYQYSPSYPIWTFSLSSPYDLTSTKTLIHTYTGVTDYSSDASPNFASMNWLADGHVLLGLERSGSPDEQVMALYLDEPYDLSTVYDGKTHTLSSITSFNATNNIVMSHNGDKIYVNDDYFIDEYTLSTPFDVSTISTSYNRWTSTHQSIHGYANTTAQIWGIRLEPSSIGTPDTYFYLGDRSLNGAYMIAWYDTNTAFASRPTLLWDSDRISMLNDSAPPRTSTLEHDLHEFLVFDSAKGGAKQIGFHNDIGS